MGIFDALTPDYYGWGPHKSTPDGLRGNGPFAYAGSERAAGGAGTAIGHSAGIGLYSGQMGNGGRADIAQAQGHFGGWRDEQGRTNVGVEGDAALARIGLAPGESGLGPFGFDVGVLTANAGAKANEETASIGAQANLIEGSVSLANKEHGIRGGLSAGVGLAGRAHYGDADGDGVREYGFGFDFGPASFDIKSEFFGHAANAIGGAGRAIGRGASAAWDAVSDW